MVGPLERVLASMLFGGLPEDLTVDNAVTLMQKALELRPGYAVYYSGVLPVAVEGNPSIRPDP